MCVFPDELDHLFVDAFALTPSFLSSVHHLTTPRRWPSQPTALPLLLRPLSPQSLMYVFTRRSYDSSSSCRGPLQASKVTVTLATELKAIPPVEELKFGQVGISSVHVPPSVAGVGEGLFAFRGAAVGDHAMPMSSPPDYEFHEFRPGLKLYTMAGDDRPHDGRLLRPGTRVVSA